MKELDSKIYHQEEYLRQNFILIHVIAENKEKDAYQQTLDFINDNLKLTILTLIYLIGLDVMIRKTKKQDLLQ